MNLNQDDFQHIYETYFNKLSKFIYFKVQSLSDAQDLLQDVFLDFYRHTITKGQDVEQVEAYLMQMTQHALARYYKTKQQSPPTLKSEQEIAVDLLQDDIDLEQSVLDHIQVDAIWDYVQTFDEVDQKLLIGHYRFNMTFKELSAQLNMPESTLKSRHSSLILKIKNYFQ